MNLKIPERIKFVIFFVLLLREQLKGYTFMAFADKVVVVSVVFKLSSFASDPPQEPEPIEACFLGNFDLYKSKLRKEYFAKMMDVENLGEKRKRDVKCYATHIED